LKPYYSAHGVDIYHGKASHCLEALEPQRVNLVVTSPPYNLLACYKGPSGLQKRTDKGLRWHERVQREAYWDDRPEPQYQTSQNRFFSRLARKCHPSASLVYNHQPRWKGKVCLHPLQWFCPEGWRLRQDIIWNVCGGTMFNARMFVRMHQYLLWYTRGPIWIWNQECVGFTTIWKISREQRQQGAKGSVVGWPIELPLRCVAALSNPGDLVLDPFMGGGTALIAAAVSGRRAVGSDIDERCCEYAARAVDACSKAGLVEAARGDSAMFELDRLQPRR